MGIMTNPTEPRAKAPVVRFARFESLGNDDDDNDDDDDDDGKMVVFNSVGAIPS